MELREKIETALRSSMPIDLLRLNENQGISGFVVSSRFASMSSFDRQSLIDQILKAEPHPLTRAELRRVSLIVAFTPVEYEFKAGDF